MTRYGIVGNRVGWTREEVFAELSKYNITAHDIIVSGGADGVDTFSQDFARSKGCVMITFYPNPNQQSPEKFYNRNLKIAKYCDELIAFDTKKNGSGTLNTINHALRLGKEVTVVSK